MNTFVYCRFEGYFILSQIKSLYIFPYVEMLLPSIFTIRTDMGQSLSVFVF